MTKEKKVLKFEWVIKELDIDKIIPYELNNKIHEEKQVNLLANIIGKFWYLDEMVVDKNNILIAGHWRLESIKKLWYDAVVVKQLDIDSNNADELRVFHNKISERWTDWHLENLKLSLDTIWYDKIIEWLEVSMKDLFPEFDAPQFNPDDYKTDDEIGEVKKVYVIITVDSNDEANELKTRLTDEWYSVAIK